VLLDEDDEPIARFVPPDGIVDALKEAEHAAKENHQQLPDTPTAPVQ
jgi:hypothetical protein